MQSSQQWRIQTLRKRWGEWGGGSHPDPEIRGGPVSKKFFFSPSDLSFGLKIRVGVAVGEGGGLGPPGPTPGSATGLRQN